MNKEVKVALFNKNTPKSKVLKSIGDIVLDNICISCETDEDLSTGDYFLDAVFIVDDEGIWKGIEEEAILKVKLDYGYEIFDIVKATKNTRDITVFARQHTIEKQLSIRLEDVRPENQNGYSALQWMLENSNEYKEDKHYARELEFSSDIETISTAYYQGMRLYEGLFDCDQSFIDRWGGEIQRRGYRTTINKKIGQDRGFQVRHAKNMSGFESETSIDSVYTRIKPKAYNGYTIDGYVQSSNIDKYATVRTITIKYEDVKLQEDCEEGEVGYETLEELQAELIRRAELEFTENHIDEIQGTYTVSFEDLSKTEEYKNYTILERCYLGDTVNVFIDKLDVNISVRAIRKKYNVMTQKVISIELSNLDLSEFKPESFAEVVKEINKLPESFQNVLQQAREEATDLINAGINGFVVVNKNEILIMDTADKNNATKVWRWNVNGLGFSSTGYYGEYNTALTMDGKLVLNELTCEGINAMLINAGILKSLNGESWINLDNGEAQLTGELRSRKGEQWVALNAGGLTFQDWNKEEQMLRVGIAYFDSNRDINGVEFAMPQYSDFIRFSHIAKPNLNEGWTSEDTFYNFFELWSSQQTVNGVVKKKGMTINSPLWINNNINIASNDSNSPHNIYNTTEGKLLICGDNGVIIGYRNGTQNLIRLHINETDDSNGCAINAYGNWNFNGGAIKNANIVNTYANTETRTVAEVSTLETNSTDNIRYIYKDITSKDNKIILNIPSEYLGRHYDIIGVAKFGFGDYRISSKEENRFIIETDREMTMNIEISIE
jgi:phage minor structural protein|nr:MAG TPA: tail protein [Caudoviricetes sp.]